MRLIDQEVQVWGSCPSFLDGAERVFEWIERAGRVCYRSEPSEKVTAEHFVKKLLKPTPPHSSVLEHSNLVIQRSVEGMSVSDLISLYTKYKSRWINARSNESGLVFWGNLRAFMETLPVGRDVREVLMEVHNDGFVITRPELHGRELNRVTVCLKTDRAVLAEITRHRDDVAFSVESQRYVDMSDVTFVRPYWLDTASPIAGQVFFNACYEVEKNYRFLRTSGDLPPQAARSLLNNQVLTIIVMTAYIPEWEWIFNLRRSTAAYPQMRILMDMVHEEFVKKGFIKP